MQNIQSNDAANSSQHINIHEIDLDLIHCVNRILGKLKKNNPDRIILARTLEQYENACSLSRGPDQSRSMYWSNKARHYWNNLAKMELKLCNLTTE